MTPFELQLLQILFVNFGEISDELDPYIEWLSEDVQWYIFVVFMHM